MMIASRELTLTDGDREIPVPIRVFVPKKENDGAWFCRYEIDWPDKKKIMDIGGFDAMQALVLALQAIGAEIYSSNYHKAGQLFFDKPGDGYGFPVVPTYRDMLRGSDRKYL